MKKKWIKSCWQDFNILTKIMKGRSQNMNSRKCWMPKDRCENNSKSELPGPPDPWPDPFWNYHLPHQKRFRSIWWIFGRKNDQIRQNWRYTIEFWRVQKSLSSSSIGPWCHWRRNDYEKSDLPKEHIEINSSVLIYPIYESKGPI